MSWLVANWYGVFALFATPAVLGVAFWVIVHRMIGERDQNDRAREARKLGEFRVTRPPIARSRRSPW